MMIMMMIVPSPHGAFSFMIENAVLFCVSKLKTQLVIVWF